jgi:hypothetical protein
MSHLRIYYMNTAGGMQFCIKRISSHVEGSGDYTSDIAVADIKIMDAVLYYHRPTPLRDKLQDAHKARGTKMPELSFFAIEKIEDMTDSINKRNGLVAYRAEGKQIEGEVVKLDHPDQKLWNQAHSLYAKWHRGRGLGTAPAFDIFVLQVTDDLEDDEARALGEALKQIHEQS